MYLIIAALVLVALYVAILVVEAKRGARFFERERARLDRTVRQGVFILAHVDFASFAKEQTRILARRLVHDIAHLSLGLVRAAERLLTQAVRRLRTQPPSARPSAESSRTFVRTLSEFKGQLESSRPKMPEAR